MDVSGGGGDHSDHFFSDAVLVDSTRLVHFEVINYNPVDVRNLRLSQRVS